MDSKPHAVLPPPQQLFILVDFLATFAAVSYGWLGLMFPSGKGMDSYDTVSVLKCVLPGRCTSWLGVVFM